MVMKEAWLQLVLNHLKTVELRGAPAPLGSTWLGCNGQVHGIATIASCALVTSEDFEATRTQHRHLGDMPRFKKTYALALKDVIPLKTCVDYYRLPASQPWTIFRTGPDTATTRSAGRKRTLDPVHAGLGRTAGSRRRQLNQPVASGFRHRRHGRAFDDRGGA